MASDVETIIRYDGDALATHEIDIQELAPALLALADMIQLANQKLNGSATKMKVTVRADIEQRCFQLHIHIFQSILAHARELFGTEDYKTAREIAEMLDLIFPAGVGGGVFWAWRKLWGKKATDASQTEYEIEQHGGTTVINNFYGDGASLEMSTSTYRLATDPEMVALGKRVLKPLEQPGYETLGFYANDDRVIEIKKDEAKGIISHTPINAPEPEPLPLDDEDHTPIKARVMVKTQRNEGKAQWELKWAARAEWATIDDLDWLERFQHGHVPVSIPFYLDVEMEMVTSKTDPDAPARFHVLKVLGVVPGGSGTQGSFLDG